MRNLIKISVAVLIMAAAVPMRAQRVTEWKPTNDTTYIRWVYGKDAVYFETGTPADLGSVVVGINNDLRKVSHLKAGKLACGAVAGIGGLWAAANAKHGRKVTAPAVVMGAAGLTALILEVVETCTLNRSRLSLTPDGVVVRITGDSRREKKNHKTPTD